MVLNVCNIVLFLKAADWFSPMIASKVFFLIILEDCSVSFIVYIFIV